jgi:poly-gamma-glutamate capsule biosynthesis protein CapA/YwtB (metallophosphatase superfamily)
MRKILTLLLLLCTFIVHGQEIVSIIGVGDIMLGTDYPSAHYLPPNNGKSLLAEVKDMLNNADLTFGNLEGPIVNGGNTMKNCPKCYAFRMPEILAQNLSDAGFDVMSVANNHGGDFGEQGRTSTLRVLKELGIQSAGLSNKPSVTFEKEGIKYGFAAFAPNIGTADLRDIPKAKAIVADLANKSDIVIVSFHGGAEGSSRQHVTRKSETFYGENRGNVYQFSHAVIDAGADVVFGHGPHVTRAIEVYKDRFIAYSLGNFCTHGRFNLTGALGVAPIIKINVDKSGRFLDGKIVSTMQSKKWVGVKIDSNNRALRYIQNLTRTDFPEAIINIDGNGLITLKN